MFFRLFGGNYTEKEKIRLYGLFMGQIWEMSGSEDRDRIFEEQLSRCGVDYFDFYLLHSIEDGNNYDTYEKYDCFNW